MDPVTLQQSKQFVVASTPRPGGYVPGRPPLTRRAAYTLSAGGSQGTSTAYTDVLQRVPFKLPVTTKRWRLHVHNYDVKTLTTITGAITFPEGVYVGMHALSGAGGWTGDFTAAPTQAIGSFATPSNGDAYVSDWVTDSAAQFTANREHLISLGWTCAGGQTVARGNGSCVYKAASADTDQTTLTGESTLTLMPLGGFWIEYEFVGDNGVGLFIGDSLTERYTNTAGRGVDSAFCNRWAQMTGNVAINHGIGGSKGTDWVTAGTEKWNRYSPANGYTIDFAHVLLGTNDLLASATATTIAGYFTSIIANLRALGIRRVYLGTVPPGSTITAGKETERLALNVTLRGMPYETLGTFDFDLALQDPTALVSSPDIYSQWEESDGLHPNHVGHFRMAKAMPGTL